MLARHLGITRAVLRAHLRVSSAKVAEYQERGLVHLHAVIRLDWPDGPGDPAPAWADGELLRQAVRTAAGIPAVTVPHPDGDGMLTLTWGAQVDARVVRREIDGELDGRMVAAYVAKYATKGTEAIGGIPVPIRVSGRVVCA